MLDAESSKPKKIVEKKKYLWIINILKESIRAKTIIKRILNPRVNLLSMKY